MIFAKYLSLNDKKLLEDGTQKHQRNSRMATCKIMTIVVSFQLSHYRNLKLLSYLCISLYKEDFPNLLSCTRFIEVMTSVIVPKCAYITSLKGNPTGIEFIDPTSKSVTTSVFQDTKISMVSLNEAKELWAGFMCLSSI
ncbi:MAG: hypothetical protein ACJAWT_002055 [Glaciecola sp.]|jgi:hypothetical protein